MASRGSVELDFLGIDKDSSSSNKSQFQKFLHGQRSFRGIQQALSKIKPEILKSVVTSNESAPVPAPNASENDATPLTIFYNGSVCVFNVPRDKAESILKIAVQGSGAELKHPNIPINTKTTNLIDPLNGDLPIARRKSLQRFLEKRKERLTGVSPYECSDN